MNCPSKDSFCTILGLDIGGTKTSVVEGTYSAEILQRYEMPTIGQRPFEQTFLLVADLMGRVIEISEQSGRRISAISVSIGGPLRIEEGILLDPPHLSGWHNVALKKNLAARFPGLPVFIEHDGNAGALAEFHFGIGRDRHDLRHLIFLTFGTGMGAGLIVNGQIVHGATDTAGEVGHFRLAQNGPTLYGKAASWEGFASGAGLVQLAAEMFPHRWTTEITISEIVDAALADDADALAVTHEAGAWMGRGLALLVDALNPQVIVLGSLAVVLGERVLAEARRVLAEEALPRAVSSCEVIPSALGKRIGDVGALMAAISHQQSVNSSEEIR